MNITMEDALRARFGETSGKIKTKFRKTINTRQFESEVIEMEAELDVGREVSGAERVAIEALLRCQMEFEVYTSLLTKGYIAMPEFLQRKTELESELSTIDNKIQVVTGESLWKFMQPQQ